MAIDSSNLVGEPKTAGKRQKSLRDPSKEDDEEECICGTGQGLLLDGTMCPCFCCRVHWSRLPEVVYLGLHGVYLWVMFGLIPGMWIAAIYLRRFSGFVFVELVFGYLTGLLVLSQSGLYCYGRAVSRFRKVALVATFSLVGLVVYSFAVMMPEAEYLGWALNREFGASAPPMPMQTALAFSIWLDMSSWGPYGSQSGTFLTATHTYLTGVDTRRPGWPCGRAEKPASLALDVYFPRREDGVLAPIVFFIHGGGWLSGSRKEIPFSTAYFLERGYGIVSPDYSFTCEGFAIAEMLDELTVAFDHVRANAITWGFDPNRIFLVGASAGGHLAVMLANKMDSPVCGRWRSCGIKGVFNLYGVMTPAFPQSVQPDYLKLATGEEDLEKQKAWFGAYVVNSSSPPTISLHGTRDSVVPYADAVLLHQNLQVAGVKQHLITAPTFEHECDMGWGSPCAQVVRFALERFLAMSDL